MRKVFIALLAILAINTFALDHIWDMRYTFGLDSKHAPKFAAGIGLKSDFNDNVLFPINILGAVSKDFDIGAKFDILTYDKMDHTQMTFDIGGRYYLTKSNFFEADGYFGLNRNNASAVVITYAFEKYIAKCFSNFYEIRAGFLDGVTGEDGYVKFSTATMPTLHFGKSFRTMIEINMSGSAGYLKDDFMIDIIPKFELSLGSARIRLDYDIGVMQEKNNDTRSIALYVMTAL